METIGPNSNVLLPLPSFIGQIITWRQSRSEVTIRWWHRRRGGQINTGGDRSNHPQLFPSACLRSGCSFPLGKTFIMVDHKGVLARVSKRTFLVGLFASIASVGRC
ncbi:hypothetical protein O181_122259 [Austropuccinia psidii MF-1]|uniref:Uncharacterized protein n=1 Tax=Austropuccinia psidii MF-1 TaxID=1389203 RepID=A0A9Q3Q252_9BASI|nr:hypothetical protein [Austropuccinia psidii MF-1]